MHPAFVEFIKEMTSVEAKLLLALKRGDQIEDRIRFGTRAQATLIKGTPAKYLGHKPTPVKEAAKEFKVGEALRDRIVVTRDEF